MISFHSITSFTACLMLSMMAPAVFGMAEETSSSAARIPLSIEPEIISEGISLRERLSFADSTIAGLTKSLIEAHFEQDRLKQQIEEVNDQMDLFGLTLFRQGSHLDKNKNLLAVIKELRLSKKENERLRLELHTLLKAAIASTQSPLNGTLQKEINIANLLLQDDAKKRELQQATDFTSGKILEVKPELSLIVTNLGARNGVNVGTPYQVWRNNHRVGTVKVIDVRDTISGAIVQNSTKMHDLLRVGDQLYVDLIR